MSWEINGVGVEPEEVYAELKHFIPPVAVLVIGADSELKEKVYKTLRKRLDEPLNFNRKGIGGHTKAVKAAIQKGQPLIVCLSGRDSTRPGLYLNEIYRLQKFGVHTVVGVFVKVSKGDAINLNTIGKDPDFDHTAYYEQIKFLAKHPPQSKIFDHFIVVENDD